MGEEDKKKEEWRYIVFVHQCPKINVPIMPCMTHKNIKHKLIAAFVFLSPNH